MLTNLRAEKQTFGERMAIDILLVAACTTFLEQIMAELLIKICYRAFYPGNQEPIYWRIFEGRVDAIKKGTFSFYCKEIVLLTEKSFDKFSNQESWNAVQMLFKLRNHLLHGQAINVGLYVHEDNSKYYFEVDNLKILQDYLIQKKLLRRDSRTMEPNDIVNDKVISHFLHCSYNFVKLAHTNIINEYEQQPIFLLDRSLSELERVLAD